MQQSNRLAALFAQARQLQAMRFVLGFFLAWPLLAAAAFEPFNLAADAAGNPVSITVAPGNWGTANPEEIQQLLTSVAAEFRSQIAFPAPTRLNIRVVALGSSPRVLYERGPAGEYVVHLTARNDRWFQYAYQFAHELCHILSNFDHKEKRGDEVVTDNQWFEETLCETASLYTLKRLARSWAAQAPAPKWTGYAPVFAAYADYLLSATHRQLPASQSLDQWYRENQLSLRESPYLRAKNELAATALLALFERAPGNWQAILYLNPDKSSATKGFRDYLADWQAACPPAQKELVRQTMTLFGLQPLDGDAAKLPEQVSLLLAAPEPHLH